MAAQGIVIPSVPVQFRSVALPAFDLSAEFFNYAI